MTNDDIANHIKKDQPKADMKSADLKVFNPNNFDTHEDAFRTLLSQTTSFAKKYSLLYIVRPAVAPVTFTNDFEEHMFQMPLIVQEKNLDSLTLYAKLKDFLIGSTGYAWIECYDNAANGHT